MEWVRPSTIPALLLFLTFLVLVASGEDGAPPAAAAVEEQSHPLPDDDEPYQLVTFQHKDGQEIRVLADGRSRLVSGFANRSGHWFYSTGREGNKGRQLIPFPESSRAAAGGGSHTEGLWNALGALANTTAASGGDDDERCYTLVGMETSGGDKKRFVVEVVANQRYLSVTGFAEGFSCHPNWIFRDGLHLTLGDDAWSSNGGGCAHAEVVASNLLAGLLRRHSLLANLTLMRIISQRRLASSSSMDYASIIVVYV